MNGNGHDIAKWFEENGVGKKKKKWKNEVSTRIPERADFELHRCAVVSMARTEAVVLKMAAVVRMARTEIIVKQVSTRTPERVQTSNCTNVQLLEWLELRLL